MVYRGHHSPRLPCDLLAVAHDLAHVLTAVLVATSHDLSQGVDDDQVELAVLLDLSDQGLHVGHFQEVGGIADEHHVQIFRLDALGHAVAVGALAHVFLTLGSDPQHAGLGGLVATPVDAPGDGRSQVEDEERFARARCPVEHAKVGPGQYTLDQPRSLASDDELSRGLQLEPVSLELGCGGGLRGRLDDLGQLGEVVEVVQRVDQPELVHEGHAGAVSAVGVQADELAKAVAVGVGQPVLGGGLGRRAAVVLVERALDVEAVARLALDQPQLVEPDGDLVCGGDVQQGLAGAPGAGCCCQDGVSDLELHGADAGHEARAFGDGVGNAGLDDRVGGEVGLHGVEQGGVGWQAGGLGEGLELGAGERSGQPEPQVDPQAALNLTGMAE